MRVLAIGNVYPPHHLGGYEIIWRGAMGHLRAEGHEARILTTGYRRADVGPGAIEDPGVHRELDWYWRDHEWRSLGLRGRWRLERHNAGVLDRHLRDFRPDAVTWWPVGGMSLGLIERTRAAGIPALLFVLDPWPSYGPRHDLWMRTWARLGPVARLQARVTGLPARVDYLNAGRWVFCSRTMREQTLAAGLRIQNSTILPPGVERAFLDQPGEREPPAWRWRLLYVGRVVEQKGVHTAIASLPLLPAEAKLQIVGEGDRPYRSRLEELASTLGVYERVRFDGQRPREQLIEVYREADAVVFPVQWSEPWGLVPLEAMALGRPVVATGRGGSGEYLADGRNALLFGAGDAVALAKALRGLAADQELRRRLTTNGYETAKRYSEDAFNRRALKEMIAVTARRSRSAPLCG
jgi:glycosyltransferase involved in cell wall biosynthesis